MKATETKPGRLYLSHDVLNYDPGGESGIWSFSLADLAALGEYTTGDGVTGLWFLVFVRRQGDWFKAPVQAEGAEQLWRELCIILGADVTPGLAAASHFSSRVIWPEEVMDAPVFRDPLQRSGLLRNRRKRISASGSDLLLSAELEFHLRTLSNPNVGTPS